MHFSRFGKNPQTNFSSDEQLLIDKEDAVNRYLQANPWIVAVHKADPEIRDFRKIQIKTVHPSEHGSIGVELDSILLNLKNLTHRSTVQDQEFKNHQPEALVGEIRAHLAARKLARANPRRATYAQVISYKADLRQNHAANFHAMMDTRQKVLWTLDTTGYLSIGDPVGNKHSVVAVGRPCLGAGQAQLQTDDRDDQYYAAKSQRERADDLEERAKTASASDKKLFLENVQALRESAKQMEEALGGYTAPLVQTRIVELDFDSGHYAPREAWKPSTDAWNEAGYQVVWSATSKFA
jgi:hypothetical protein